MLYTAEAAADVHIIIFMITNTHTHTRACRHFYVGCGWVDGRIHDLVSGV